MALSLTSHLSLLSPLQNPKTLLRLYCHHQTPNLSIPFSRITKKNPRRFSSFRIHSSFTNEENEPNPFTSPIPINKPSESENSDENSAGKIVDEWGEKAEPEPDSSYTKFSDSDPPKDEDEWGGGEDTKYSASDNGTAAAGVNDDKIGDLKRCLVDTFYGTELGFKASAEVRAEVLELVNQLESLNPTPAPTEASTLLDGNWVLLYTAFSELLPLLAAGTIPLLKVKRICQSINTTTLTIDNSTTLSSPFATFSFSASATFEVRSPSRIQVSFKEGSLQPPEISSSLSLPQNIDIFGQKIDLSPVQTSLNPLQDAVANISRAISGQPPLKVPIPGDRTSSWLLITYLDEDFRISRGDGGLFILAKEGSPLLEQ
ncbi:Plastid lipid-associated protein/fibrillin conserved domain [Macleaya cordata]|uniref:Plastid lipid-associated protein/fibrillin conserved domain n=1 Tax=Macleaya cordata TaxID=56857 RepID=A0A200PXE4_MACCD|nr:Plastid lipid-associated protein/fibrillin conserved domain [Macleaya cordata]